MCVHSLLQFSLTDTTVQVGGLTICHNYEKDLSLPPFLKLFLLLDYRSIRKLEE